MLSANQVQLLEAKFENECGSWFEILLSMYHWPFKLFRGRLSVMYHFIKAVKVDHPKMN